MILSRDDSVLGFSLAAGRAGFLESQPEPQGALFSKKDVPGLIGHAQIHEINLAGLGLSFHASNPASPGDG